MRASRVSLLDAFGFAASVNSDVPIELRHAREIARLADVRKAFFLVHAVSVKNPDDANSVRSAKRTAWHTALKQLPTCLQRGEIRGVEYVWRENSGKALTAGR